MPFILHVENQRSLYEMMSRSAWADARASQCMDALDTTAARALRVLLDSQPTTPAKVAFAWRMSAGPALGRATTVQWQPDGVLIVRASTPAWLKELRHARPLLTARIRDLVGPDVVKKLVIE